MYLPNVFSPNNDGVNDRFTVFGDEPNVQSVLSMKIYDRWGGLVFESEPFAPNDTASGWDGNNSGEAVAVGTYVYEVQVLFFDGRVLGYSGAVDVLR